METPPNVIYRAKTSMRKRVVNLSYNNHEVVEGE